MAAGQGLAGGKGALEPLPGAAAEQAAVAGEVDGLADRGEVALVRGEQGAHLVQVRQGADQVLPLLERAALRHVALPQRHRGEHGDVGLHAAAEEAAVQLTGAHGQGQARDLGGAGVDLHAVQVPGQDEPGDLALAVAALQVHLGQQLEGVDQDVARAAGRVAQGDVLGAADPDEVLVLGVGLDVVLHLVAQGARGVVEHPQAPQRVLHHVAHDPVGREQLGGRAYGVGGLLGLGGEEGVLDLGVVVLVHPAQDLDVIPVLLGDVAHHAADDAVGVHEVGRQEQRHAGVHGLEHAGQAPGELGALGQEQVAEERPVLAGLLELGDAHRVRPLDLHVERLVRGLAAQLPGAVRRRAGEHAHAGGQEVVDLHVAHGGDAVEPGVGGAVAQVGEALLGPCAQQGVAPLGLLRGQGAPAHRRRAGGLCALGHAVEPHAGLDAGDELVAGPDAVVLDGGIVHGYQS